MSFAQDLKRFADATLTRHDKVKKAFAISLFGSVIMDTPVDTGRLRGNWQCSIGSQDTSVTDNTDKYGSLTVNAMQLKVKGSRGEDAIFLSNSLPYASRIEYDGWSHTKAPNGMVRRNVARANEILKAQLAKIK